MLIPHIMMYIRPIWKTEVNSYMYEDDLLCKMWCYATTIVLIISSFLPTLFAYAKAQYYFTLLYPTFKIYFTVLVWFGPILGAISIILANPQGRVEDCFFRIDSLASIFIYIFNALDLVFNNMLMFFTIFGHEAYIRKDNEIRQRIETMSFENDCAVIEVGIEVADYAIALYWVDLPGLEPMQITHEVVAENQLWDFVLSERQLRRQIRRYNNRGAFLSRICRSTEELADLVN